MGACVINGVELATEVKKGYASPLDVHAFGSLIRDLRFLGYWDKLGHGNLLTLSVSLTNNGSN